MAEVPVFAAGGYRYIKGAFQYSGGIAAEADYEIERARFAKPLPLADGFAAVEAHLKSIGRPATAFAACELRSPAPFTDQGFYDFNKAYVVTLERWGIYQGGDQPVNPVARTNVCPMYDKPAGPVVYAFSYTVPAGRGIGRGGDGASRGGFITAGAGESKEGGASGSARVVRADDTSPEGMREKVICVVEKMERRLELLGYSWKDAVTTQAYTVQNIGHLVGEAIAARGACASGLVWHYARPPVIGLEYEMDVRGVARELVI